MYLFYKIEQEIKESKTIFLREKKCSVTDND